MNSETQRISNSQHLIRDLYEFAKRALDFDQDATIVIKKDVKNSENPLGNTAYYDPAKYKICLYTSGRHIKDIMRSLAHELVHHKQNCRGDFNNGTATVQGYAQEDGHLREMEREAYETGNMIFRDWEDGLKAKTDNKQLFSVESSLTGEKLMEDAEWEKLLLEYKEKRLRRMVKRLIKEELENKNETEEVSQVDSVESSTGSESFLPKTHDIRSKSRQMTHDALMKRWGYTKENE